MRNFQLVGEIRVRCGGGMDGIRTGVCLKALVVLLVLLGAGVSVSAKAYASYYTYEVFTDPFYSLSQYQDGVGLTPGGPSSDVGMIKDSGANNPGTGVNSLTITYLNPEGSIAISGYTEGILYPSSMSVALNGNLNVPGAQYDPQNWSLLMSGPAQNGYNFAIYGYQGGLLTIAGDIPLPINVFLNGNPDVISYTDTIGPASAPSLGDATIYLSVGATGITEYSVPELPAGVAVPLFALLGSAMVWIRRGFIA